MQTLSIAVCAVIISLFLIVVWAGSEETALYEKSSWVKFFCEELINDARIVFKTIFKRPKSFRRLLKNIQQTGLYLLEITVVCGLMLILAQWISPVSEIGPGQFFYEQFTRFLSFYAAYQIFVFTVLNISVSSRCDEWLSVKRLVRLAILYFETKNTDVKEMLDLRLKDALDPYTFLDGEPLKIAQEVGEIIRKEKPNETDLITLKRYEIVSEHYSEFSGLYWHFSFLLNAMK